MNPPEKHHRRNFIRSAAAVLIGGATLAAARSRSPKLVWQIDPEKCTRCGRCATHCVLAPSAVKCFHSYSICGYCDLCGGYLRPDAKGRDTGAENQLCPTAAIKRTYIEDPYYQYKIDEDLCIGCGICVEGCDVFGNGSMYMQVKHNICVNCNECAIARACPSDAFKKNPLRQGLSSEIRSGEKDFVMTAKTLRNKCPRLGGLSVFASLRLIALLLFVAVSAQAEFRFPMPEFSEGYEHPAVHTPMPTNSMVAWDAVVLIATLALASFLVLKRRKRKEIFWLTLFSVIYFGFIRNGCVCSVGSVQNIIAGICDPGYGVPLTVLIFFAAPLIFALLFGRIFCSAVCPLGAIQEVVAVKPIKVPPAVDKVLSVFPFIYLGLAALSVAMDAGFIICQYDPFVGFFRMGASFSMLIFGALMLIIGVFVARPYCRFLCPYGVLLNWCSKLSRHHAVITPTECIKCDLCADSCPYNAINEPTPDEEPESRSRGAWRLGILILLLPILTAGGFAFGGVLKEPLSRMHPSVRLAERVAGEELGRYEGTNIESEAFRGSDQPIEELYAEATELKEGFGIGGRWLGAFIGLVIGSKLIGVSILRRRDGFEPDRGTCYSCGRCFKYCPVKE